MQCIWLAAVDWPSAEMPALRGAERCFVPVQPAKVQMVSMFNNFYGSLVQAQNQLLAPLAPFGRKLQQTNPVSSLPGRSAMHACPLRGALRLKKSISKLSTLSERLCALVTCLHQAAVRLRCSTCVRSQGIHETEALTLSQLPAQFLRSQVVKGNAIGSIFYGVGFSTPGVVAEAFTGNDGTGTTGLFGRRLLQTADPYHLTSKVFIFSPF